MKNRNRAQKVNPVPLNSDPELRYAVLHGRGQAGHEDDLHEEAGQEAEADGGLDDDEGKAPVGGSLPFQELEDHGPGERRQTRTWLTIPSSSCRSTVVMRRFRNAATALHTASEDREDDGRASRLRVVGDGDADQGRHCPASV